MTILMLTGRVLVPGTRYSIVVSNWPFKHSLLLVYLVLLLSRGTTRVVVYSTW